MTSSIHRICKYQLVICILFKLYYFSFRLEAVYKGRPANGEGVVMKIRTFPDEGSGVLSENSDVRKFQIFSELIISLN